MFEISRQARKRRPGIFLSRTPALSLGLSLGLSLAFALAGPNCAFSQDGQQIPTVQDHDIEIVESPFLPPQAI